MRRTVYDFVCSIGHYCGAAMYLRRHCLRSMSSPLDWIGEDPGGLANHVDLVCRDFAGFMERENLTRLENPRTPVDDLVHDYYRDEGTGVLLYHDFPSDVPLDASYPRVREKFDRRIARFYATVAASRRALLVYHTRSERLDDAAVTDAAARLRAKLGEGVDLLVVESVPGMEGLDVRELAPGVDYARGWFFRPERHHVLGDIPLSDRVYGRIRCRGQFLRRIQKRFKRLAERFSSRRPKEVGS